MAIAYAFRKSLEEALNDFQAGGVLAGFLGKPTLAAGVATGAALGSDVIKTTTAQSMDAKTLTACAGIAMTAGRIQGAAGADVNSANNLTLGTDGNTFRILGTTAVNLIDSTGWQSGSMIVLYFAGALTVVNGVAVSGAFKTLALNAGANFVTVAGSTLSLVYIASNAVWSELGRKA